MSGSKAVLYDVRWQVMRVRMLGSWNDLNKAIENHKQLLEYSLEDVPKQERIRRLWRIVNYLNAIRMGYSGQEMLGTQVDKLLIEQRAGFQNRLQQTRRQVKTLGEWDWEAVKTDLQKLYSTDILAFELLRVNLHGRKQFATKKVGSTRYRDDLEHFLALMEEVRNV